MLWIRKNTRENAYQHHSDGELIQLYQQSGKEAYVAELFQRYASKVYIIAQKYVNDRETSKDIVMTVFEKVIKNLRKTEVQTFGNWVHTITKNECNQYHRTQNNQAKKIEDWGIQEKNLQNNVENNPLMHLINAETDEATKKELHTAINSLKEKHRVCIQLYYFEKKSYKEISELTGYSTNEVKSYLQHAKNNLRKFLTKK